VKDEETDTFTSEYPDLDITFAKVEEKGDNLNFTLQVKGNIVTGDYLAWYNFLIKSVDASESIWVLFKNSQAYISLPGGKVYCDNTIEDNTLTITVPKIAFKNIKHPWDVIANAILYIEENRHFDELTLEGGLPESSETTVPGFEAVAVLIAASLVFMLWRKQRRSR